MQICDAHNDLLTTFDNILDINNYLNNFCINNKVVKIFTAYYVSQYEINTYGSDKILQHIAKKYLLVKNLDIATFTLENIGFIQKFSDLDKIIYIADNIEPEKIKRNESTTNNNLLSKTEELVKADMDECIKIIIEDKKQRAQAKGRIYNPMLDNMLLDDR